MLHDIQRMFKKSILQNTDDLTSVIHNPREGFSASDRLSIYRNTVILSLKELLFERFSATKKMVGEEFFNTICHNFISQHPPKVGCLMYYGSTFSAYLSEEKSLQPYNYVVDIAHIEWLMQESYNAEDEHSMLPEHFAKIQGEALEAFSPKLCKNVHMFKSTSPIVSLFNITKIESCDREIEKIDLTKPEIALIYRDTHKLDVEVLIIDAKIHHLYSALENGMSLGTYCQENEINQNTLTKSMEIALNLGLWKHNQPIKDTQK